MNLPKLLLFLLLAGQFSGHAGTLQVGPGEPYASIQAAIDSAAPGDTIRVAAGTYHESLVINKSPLILEGARVAVSARGRVSDTPNPAVESIVDSPTGTALEIATAAGVVSVSGFSFVATVSAGTGVVTLPVPAAPGLVLSNNHIIAAAGSFGSSVRLTASAENATVSGNVFLAAADSEAAASLGEAGTWHGIHFLNNDFLRTGAVAHAGLLLRGNRNVGTGARMVRINGNQFRGHAIGIDAGGQALEGAEISGNTFTVNGTGFAGGPKTSSFTGNVFSDNSLCGLHFTSAGHSSDGAWGSSGCVVEGNTFNGNGASANPSGYGDVRIDDQAGATQGSHVFRRNKLLSNVALFSNEPSATIQASRNFWGSNTGPGIEKLGGVGSVSWAPFYKDSALETLDFGSAPVTGVTTIAPGESLEAAQLTLTAGAELRVRRGSVRVGLLSLAPGSLLDVVNGELSLDPVGAGLYHTLSGSFTFFDCLGSLNINGNTTFSGSTLGLVSDIHIAPGVTLLVLGSLTLDGCTLSSPGNWNLLVNLGASFHMTRCGVTGGFLSFVGGDVVLQDNIFYGTSLTAFSTVSGAAIFHNVLTAGSYLTALPWADVTTSGEGWGNVTSAAFVENSLELNFRAPVNPTRTLDAEGNLYVQPGDPVAAGLDIGHLNVKAQATEVLLGYNTDYVAFSSLVPSAGWNNSLYEASDETAVIGRFNSTVGLGFAHPDPDGTTQDGAVADVSLQARAIEGRTSLFFRKKSGADHALIDTRITASAGGVPFFRSMPYTRNAGTLTVDGTVPQFHAVATAIQTQESGPVDVTQVGAITHQGTITVTFDAVDQLAGVDDVDVSVALNGLAGTVTGTLTGTALVSHSGVVFTRYICSIPVVASTPNGTYNIDASVMDRSGNSATFAIGALQIQKNQIAVTVQPQGLVTAPITRNVIFTATDSLGQVLSSWNIPVLFTGGSGSATLLEVPDGTVNLSARMAWNLRTRLPAALDLNGQASVSFTGGSRLKGGDLNGDNLINLADYNIMRFVFPSSASAPDITGDGQTNLADYNILRANWLTVGAPL